MLFRNMLLFILFIFIPLHACHWYPTDFLTEDERVHHDFHNMVFHSCMGCHAPLYHTIVGRLEAREEEIRGSIVESLDNVPHPKLDGSGAIKDEVK